MDWLICITIGIVCGIGSALIANLLGEMNMSVLLMFFGNMICFLLGCLYSDWRQR